MKKLLFIIAMVFSTSMLVAQKKEAEKSKQGSSLAENSLVKINLLALPLRNFSLSYEYKVARKTTVGMGFRFMPKGGLPLQSSISNLIDDPDTEKQLNEFKTSNIAFTPEVRFYLGKEAMRGFYIAPFARYSSYTASLPFEFDVNGTKQTMPLSGNLNTLTGGILFGAQWKLGGKVYLDWWMLGPQYGSAKGSLDGKRSLNLQEQTALRNDLEDLQIPFANTTTTVDGNGARLDIKGPWAGLRSGLSLGVRF